MAQIIMRPSIPGSDRNRPQMLHRELAGGFINGTFKRRAQMRSLQRRESLFEGRNGAAHQVLSPLDVACGPRLPISNPRRNSKPSPDHQDKGDEEKNSHDEIHGCVLAQPAAHTPLHNRSNAIVQHQRQQARHQQPDDLLEHEQNEARHHDRHRPRDRARLGELFHEPGCCTSPTRIRRARRVIVRAYSNRIFTATFFSFCNSAKKSVRNSTTQRVSSSATICAMRGASSNSAISPKNSPAPNSTTAALTSSGGGTALTRPLTMKNNPSPASPTSHTISYLWYTRSCSNSSTTRNSLKLSSRNSDKFFNS